MLGEIPDADGGFTADRQVVADCIHHELQDHAVVGKGHGKDKIEKKDKKKFEDGKIGSCHECREHVAG